MLQESCEKPFPVAQAKVLSLWKPEEHWNSVDTARTTRLLHESDWSPWCTPRTHHTVLNTKAQLVLGVRAPDDGCGDRGTVHNVQSHLCLVLQLLKDGRWLCRTLAAVLRGDAAMLLRISNLCSVGKLRHTQGSAMLKFRENL